MGETGPARVRHMPRQTRLGESRNHRPGGSGMVQGGSLTPARTPLGSEPSLGCIPVEGYARGVGRLPPLRVPLAWEVGVHRPRPPRCPPRHLLLLLLLLLSFPWHLCGSKNTGRLAWVVLRKK